MKSFINLKCKYHLDVLIDVKENIHLPLKMFITQKHFNILFLDKLRNSFVLK